MLVPYQMLLFVLLTALAVLASHHAWRTGQRYGSYRFVAFELLIALVVRNARRWFQEPFSSTQIVSWVIMLTVTALAIHGLYLLKTAGRARARLVEDTQAVVRVGAYRFIRHPLYSSLMFLGWGVFFKGVDLVSAALASAATAFWFATARQEERYNVFLFGAEYEEYIKRTKMFVPFVL